MNFEELRGALIELISDDGTIRSQQKINHISQKLTQSLCKNILDLSSSGITTKLLDKILHLLYISKYPIEKIDIRSNRLEALPDSIGIITTLDEIEAEYNSIESLPTSIVNLKNTLKFLYLGHNLFRHFPECICQLENLRNLYLGHNQLESLPDEIDRLINLRKLDLIVNKLRSLPASLSKIDTLYALNLGGNRELAHIPDSIRYKEGLALYEP